jgi:hypothetical protein
VPGSTPTRRDIFVTPIDDRPEVKTSEVTTTYFRGEKPVPVDPKLTILDADDDVLEGAWVQVAKGFSKGDELLFVDQLGISGEYDAESGFLKLGGRASVGDYEEALRSIEYQNVRGEPSRSLTVEFVVSDGDAESAAASKPVEVVEP